MTLIHSPCPLHLIQCSLSRSSLLNIALSKWEYLRQVVRAGHLGNVISALGDLHASGLLSSKTETARDVEETLFWLNRFAHDFEESPAKMEEITLQAPLDSQKVRSLSLPHSAFSSFTVYYAVSRGLSKTGCFKLDEVLANPNSAGRIWRIRMAC